MPTLDAQRFGQIAARDPADVDIRQLAEDVQAAPALFRWCLRPEVKDRLAEYFADDQPPLAAWWRRVPSLPAERGSCWVVFTRPHARQSLLREAFPLPFVWSDGSHRSLVPHRLEQLAAQIVDHLSSDLDLVRGGHWQLEPAGDGLAGLDLSWLDVRPESGWAPLAAGLVVAARGGDPDRAAWASGEWDPATGRWSLDLHTLEAKLRAARDFGATTFYLPADLKKTAEHYLGENSGVRIGELLNVREKPPSLRIAVRTYTAAWSTRPTASDPFATRANYFLDAFHDSSRRDVVAEFYNECLAEDIAKGNREFLDTCGELQGWSPSHLATIVSDSFELVHLGYWLLRPRHCLLIFTRQEGLNPRSTSAEKLAAWLRERNVEVQFAPIDDSPAMVGQIQDHVQSFSGGVEASQLVLDLTPGKRLMTLSLLESAPAGSRVLCWLHDSDPQVRRVIPGSELPLVWQVGIERRLVPLLVRSRT